MDDRGNWHIYSLTRHINTMHFKMPESSVRKRHRSVTLVASHPPDTAQFKSLMHDEEETSLEAENTANRSASFNDSHSMFWNALSLPENEMTANSSVLQENLGENQSDHELEYMEEERIDEHDGNFENTHFSKYFR